MVVGGRKTQRSVYSLLASFNMCHVTCQLHAMHVFKRSKAMVLIGDAKQAISEGKSGLVETRVAGPATTALM